MIIEKTASQSDNYLGREYYYGSAREGMFDLLCNIFAEGMIDTVFLPGYIGWSPKEGSGIFDPINNLEGLQVQYYKMTSVLNVDCADLFTRISTAGKFAVLVVNYFGFIDPTIKDIAYVVKAHSGWLIEDNAHGFFTYQYTEETYSDATFFSLHKMFPFKRGGSLIVHNKRLAALKYSGVDLSVTDYNPWQYDVRNIARVRRKNYVALENIVNAEGVAEYFIPLKSKGLMTGTVPQTFPIRIIKGDRNKIYELMNELGYGVVSLYHTLIEPLQCSEYQLSLDLSQCVMNLPVHQDVDTDKYGEMVRLLVELCKATSQQ
jgi:dTDP-4-amino-4,6-dideoxygalactose transaminase